MAASILGFHAQQAAEKMLKAALAASGVEFPFTHRLADLLDLLSDGGVSLPDRFDEVRFLTPYAVDFRYDLYDEDDEPFVAAQWLALLEQLRDWAEAAVRSAAGA